MNDNLTNIKIFNTICEWIEQEEKEMQIKRLRQENEKLKEYLKQISSFKI